eukprot:537422-Pleurochrysis_carterae.AAC.1
MPVAPVFARWLRELSLFEPKRSSNQDVNLGHKFSEAFELTFGDLTVFNQGLQGRIGHPSRNVAKAMKIDHCASFDSYVAFTTTNYDVTSIPKIEWFCVDDQQEGMRMLNEDEDVPEELRMRDGTMHTSRFPGSAKRKFRSRDQLRLLMDEKNIGLRKLRYEELEIDEMVAACLYTGARTSVVQDAEHAEGCETLNMQSPNCSRCKGGALLLRICSLEGLRSAGIKKR